MTPFVLITPLGMADRAALRAEFWRLGIQVRAVQAVPRFLEAANAVYVRCSSAEARRRARKYERAWRRHFGEAEGEIWWLGAGYARLCRLKHSLGRRTLGFPGGWLHGFHVSDPDDLALEAGRLLAATA